MRKKFYSLDLGNKSLKFVVAEEDENGKTSVLTKIYKNIDSFINGEIIDSENFEAEVIDTIKEVSYQTGEEVKEILLSFSAPYFIYQRSKGKISVSEKYVTEDDVRRCISVAKVSISSGSYEIVYEEAISYFLDGSQIKIRDPLGMEAHSLEVDFFVIQGLKSSINKIREFFKQNGIKIISILPNPLPASFVCLSKKEKELGVILVDFGYRFSTICIFQEGKLMDYKVFQLGLGDILEDLILDLGIDFEKAQYFFEEIQKEDLKKITKIKLGKKYYTKSYILKFLEKKLISYSKKKNLNEFFKNLKETIKLPAGIYLVGGGSYMPEIENIFKKISGYNTKIANDTTNNLNPEERIFLNNIGSISYFQKIKKDQNIIDIIKEFFRSLRG